MATPPPVKPAPLVNPAETLDTSAQPAPSGATQAVAQAAVQAAMQSEVQVLQVQPSHAAPLAELFERAASPCFCRWYDFHGDKNTWLDRCYNHPTQNQAELLNAVAQQELGGFIAVALGGEAPNQGDPQSPGGPVSGGNGGNHIVGWMRLERAEGLPKLYDQRLYRGLPCFGGDRSGVMAVGCFLVDPAWRGRGVARKLLEAGIAAAKQAGATAVEAFPRRDTELAPEAVWTGPFELYTELGFEIVNDFRPYPVLRRTLAGT